MRVSPAYPQGISFLELKVKFGEVTFPDLLLLQQKVPDS